MLVMVESGQLGNEIFQYVALRSTARKGERILLFGFDQLRAVFESLDATTIPISSNPLVHLRSIEPARLARSVPMLGLIQEDTSGLPVRAGDRRHCVVDRAWFQSGVLLDSPVVSSLRVRPDLLTGARDTLAEAHLDVARTAFVHVRAGDYRSWPTPDAPAILDRGWYHAQIAELRASDPGLALVFIGDEPEYTREVMEGVPNAMHVQAGYAVEFALMTLLSSGVLSASTFALWGARLAHRENPSGRFIAPQYWAGRRAGTWLPETLRAQFVEYR